MLETYESFQFCDYLLYVLTARQDTTYAQFKTVIESLYRSQSGDYGEEPRGNMPFIVHQSLETAGHCNSNFEKGNSEIWVQPPALNRLPLAGNPQAVLTGGRAAETVPLMATTCQETGREDLRLIVNQAPDTVLFVPLRVVLRATSESGIKRVAGETGIKYCSVPPAFQIARSLGTLDEYLESLPAPKTGMLRSWPGRREYFPGDFRFREGKRNVETLRLLRYKHPNTGRRCFFLFRGDKRHEVDREWGRYAVLRETSLHPIVYDKENMRVAVPNGARLPSPHARALSLCSGYPPRFLSTSEVSIRARLRVPRPEQFGYHVYRWVPPKIVSTIAASLDQHVLSATIELETTRPT